MPTLPTSTIDLSAGVSFVSQPPGRGISTRKPTASRGSATAGRSVRQAVEVILNVERFRWQIYSPYSGMQWDGSSGRTRGMWPRNFSGVSPRR